ncbi:hypothetical protein OSB04_001703 [Centaurea solstitialis]|uniref:Myb/SANT-like domain-containing protein n=1 Tax=Centaurea solstitialis TaxID=347529 RepID=A0AA38U9M5_9ASTR|nr:hypothetical protein OSB04_001703 [Centaurea solstitialis]
MEVSDANSNSTTPTSHALETLSVLRSPFYPIKLQGRMVIACTLLYNFIRMYMAIDPEENTTLTVDDMFIGEEMFGSNDDVGSIDIKSKRWWIEEISITEEDLLISILQEIVVAGGRSDNGSFWTGTHDQIVLKMGEKILGLNITSKHVQNKMKRLKDKYSTAYDMLNTSGFGWDDTKQWVTVDAYMLEEYLKTPVNRFLWLFFDLQNSPGRTTPPVVRVGLVELSRSDFQFSESD